MKNCLRCKRLLVSGVAQCPGCGSTSFYTSALANSAAPRPSFKLVLGIIWCVLCLTPATLYIISEAKTLGQVERELAAEKNRFQLAQEESFVVEKARLQQPLRELDAQWEKKLQNKEWISGQLAASKREAEWKQRLRQDPQFAQTLAERRLVEMAQLAQSSSLKTEEILEKAALLAAPPGARVEVSPAGGRYDVRIAFHMSALGQTGAFDPYSDADLVRTKLNRRSAQLIQDLYATCGNRGLGHISVSCNHEVVESFVPKHADPFELELFKRRARPVMTSVYRVSLGPDALARLKTEQHISSQRFLEMLKVEKDGLVDLRLSKDLPGVNSREANVGLEF